MMSRGAKSALVCGALLSVSLLAGCEGYVKRGSALYAERRYIEAAEVFERTEERLSESSPRQRAEYGLYRGLTLLVLGDYAQARQWLGYAAEVERQYPGTLRDDRRAELDRGFYELNERGAPAMPSQPAQQTAILTSPLPQASPLPTPAPPPGGGQALERRSFLPE